MTIKFVLWFLVLLSLLLESVSGEVRGDVRSAVQLTAIRTHTVRKGKNVFWGFFALAVSLRLGNLSVPKSGQAKDKDILSLKVLQTLDI